MPDDERDKAGVVAPPPLIYACPLLLGLLLSRRFPISFLPRTVARILGWPLVGGGALLLGWFEWTMRRAGTPTNPYKPSSSIRHRGAVPLHAQPRLPIHDDDLRGGRRFG